MRYALCRHDAWIQPWRVTHQCCIQASCRTYRVETLLKGLHDTTMQHRELLAGAAFVHHDDKCHLLATCILKWLNRYSVHTVEAHTVYTRTQPEQNKVGFQSSDQVYSKISRIATPLTLKNHKSLTEGLKNVTLVLYDTNKNLRVCRTLLTVQST